MKKISFHILRIGLAITFLWIGAFILRQPEAWTAYIKPWIADLLPVPLTQIMTGTALFDIAIGALLLLNAFVWIAALAGALHLITVLAVSGITAITVRDIAIFAGALALFIDSLPASVNAKIIFWQKQKNT